MGESVRSYSEKEVFVEKEITLFRRAMILVNEVPEAFDLRGLRCHELARAVTRMLEDEGEKGLEVVDGNYGPVEHSWITIPRPFATEGFTILDVYACGRMPQVQLVHNVWALPEHRLYQPGPRRDDINLKHLNYLLDFWKRND
jgi:hypothetical protein